jgi:hypothetical protein
MGALTGAITGLIFYGAGSLIPVVSGALGATTALGQVAVTTAVHTVAGAVSGAINSAITGSDIGLGALTGAVAAGIGSVTGSILPNKFGYQLVGRVVSGAIAGGIVSEIYGGNFWSGFGQGAYTAAAGFLFNCVVHGYRFTTASEFKEQLSSYGLGGLPGWAQAVLYAIFVDPTSMLVGGGVTFGQAGHGARHLVGTGLSEEAVRSAITLEVNAIKSTASELGNFWGRITISGKTIEYRAWTLPDGTIHVGTHYPLR